MLSNINLIIAAIIGIITVCVTTTMLKEQKIFQCPTLMGICVGLLSAIGLMTVDNGLWGLTIPYAAMALAIIATLLLRPFPVVSIRKKAKSEFRHEMNSEVKDKQKRH